MWRTNRSRFFFTSLMLATALFFAGISTVQAADPKKAEKPKTVLGEKIGKSESPIRITADRMEAKQDDRTIVFEGNVLVQQDDLTLTGNRLKVAVIAGEKSSTSNTSTPSEKIDYIEVDGNVKVTQKDRLATAERAIFYQKDQKIVLHGRPVVSRGQDRIEGKLITIYLQQGRSVVEGGSGSPVQAVLFPGKKE